MRKFLDDHLESVINVSKYSRMDQVKFAEGNLSKI